MIESIKNIFSDGWIRDVDPRVNNSLSDAQDVEFVTLEEEVKPSIKPLKSFGDGIIVPDAQIQPQVIRIKFVAGQPITLKGYNPDTPDVLEFSYTGTPASASAFITALNAVAPADFLFANVGLSGDIMALRYYRISPTIFDNLLFTQTVSGTPFKVYVVQVGIPSVTRLTPVESFTLEGETFVLSTGTGLSEIGHWKSGVYTRLYRSNQLIFPNNVKIDMTMERDSSGRYALYVCYEGMHPLVYYISELTQDSMIKYTLATFKDGTDGYIIPNYEIEQTRLQVVNNSLFVKFKEQRQAGGELVSGGYRYAVRSVVDQSGLGTEFSQLTPNVIPVYKAGNDSPNSYMKIEGVVGESTTKSNIVTVTGLKPEVFQYVELACIRYPGEVATIVGRYKVTGDTMDIVHTGTEVERKIETSELPAYTDIIESAGSMMLKKKRLNLANLEYAYSQDLSSIFSSATMETGMEGIGFSGYLSQSARTVFYGNILSGNLIIGSIPVKMNVNNISTNESGAYSGGAYNVPLSIGASTLTVNFQMVLTLPNAITLYVIKNGATFSAVNFIGSNFSLYTKNGVTLPSVTISANVPVVAGDKLEFAVGSVIDSNMITITTFSNISISTNEISSSTLSPSEYLDPVNCANKVGYMLNETYPYFAVVHYTNGYNSDPYFIGYHKFEFDTIKNNNKILTNRQMGGTINSIEAYSYYLKLSGLDLSSLKGKASHVSIWRGECNPTVLGTGVVLTSDNDGVSDFQVGSYQAGQTTPGVYSSIGATNTRRRWGVFVSPDTKASDSTPPVGKLKVFGAPQRINQYSGIIGPSNKFGSFAEYYGAVPNAQEYTLDILDVDFVNFNSKSEPLFNPVENKTLRYNGDVDKSGVNNCAGIALTVDGFIYDPLALTNDNGLYMAQYIAELDQQYDLNSIRVVPTGAIIDVNEWVDSFSPSIKVFGGDTYTQKSFIKLSYFCTPTSSTPLTNVPEGKIYSSFISYYSQSRFNEALRFTNQGIPATYNLKEAGSPYSYLFNQEKREDVVEEQFNYDDSFSALNILNRSVPYNSENLIVSSAFARIIYTDKKVANSAYDSYRVFKPLDYKDLDAKNGTILSLVDIGQYVVSLQRDAVVPMTYNTDAFVPTTAGAIQTSSGSVYNNNEDPVSIYGPSSKWAVVVGKNRNGNKSLYWMSDWSKRLLRYGPDGVAILSEGRISSYLMNKLIGTSRGGYRGANKQLYFTFETTDGDVTIGWNEERNLFTGRYSFTPDRYITIMDELAVGYNGDNSAKTIALGDGYLGWIGAAFIAEFLFNKMPDASKRPFAFAINTGEKDYTFPDVTVSSEGITALAPVKEHRRGQLIGNVKEDEGKYPIGQWIKLNVRTEEEILILDAILRVGYKRRMV